MSLIQALPSHQLSQRTSEIELYIQARSWGNLRAEAGRALAEVELSGTDCFPGRSGPDDPGLLQ